MSNSVKERNYCLDFVKLIACIFIILRHIQPLGDGWTAVATLTRCFVPFFFMVSGYYCFRKDGLDKKSMKPKIFYILKLTVITYALYVAITFFAIYKFGEPSILSVGDIPGAFVKLLVFNQPMFIPEFIWFLFALLYVYIIYVIIQRFNLYRLAYWLIPVLIFASLFMTYGGLIFDFEIPNYYYRNFLFEGLPFFMLGHLIHKKQSKINIPNLWLWIILIASTAFVLVETHFTGMNFDLNITNYIQVGAIFLLAVKNPNFGKGVFANLGRDLSMYVYVIHIAIRRVALAAYSILGFEGQLYKDIFPVVVMVGSLVASFVLFHIIKFIGSKRRKIEEK